MNHSGHVAALVGGDGRGAEGVYRDHADALYTYCLAVLRDAAAAGKAVRDTFVTARDRAGRLRDPDRLQPWLYALARNACQRRSDRGHPAVPAAWVPAVDGSGTPAVEQVRRVVWAACENLTVGGRQVFELSVRPGIAAADIGEILRCAEDEVEARVARVRAEVDPALRALLVGRTDISEYVGVAHGHAQLHPGAVVSAYAALPPLAVPAEVWPAVRRAWAEPPRGLRHRLPAWPPWRSAAGTGFPLPHEVQLRRRRWALAALPTVAVAAVAAGALLVPQLVGGPAGRPPDGAPPGAAGSGLGGGQDPAGALGTRPVGATGAPDAVGVVPSAVPGRPVPGGAAGDGAPGEVPTEPTGAVAGPAPQVPPGPPAPPGPPGGPSAPPPASPAPPAPEPGPLHVDATGRVACEGSSRSFRLEVTATASGALSDATLFVTVGGSRRDYPMAVTGASAAVVSGPLPPTASGWWVGASGADGGSAGTAVTSLNHPCG